MVFVNNKITCVSVSNILFFPYSFLILLLTIFAISSVSVDKYSFLKWKFNIFSYRIIISLKFLTKSVVEFKNVSDLDKISLSSFLPSTWTDCRKMHEEYLQRNFTQMKNNFKWNKKIPHDVPCLLGQRVCNVAQISTYFISIHEFWN